MTLADIVALGPWAWFIAGLLLMALEILAPGAFMLWLGLAAVATGLVASVVDMSWQITVLVFAALSLASVLVGRRILRERRPRTGETALNNRSAKIVGRTFVLDAPIEQGRGRVKVDDTVWRVEGPDLPQGARIRVTGVDGTLLKVAEA
ncbi:NfeD family protein [Alsobacter sp. SYSU M60028]|uniref:NfeD family protein n=1 Tax=Alsobacter ponti TaxID=2962936 RepID=A0ABT1LE18_9HYPH|nr:NfeD family protein [Alsobacter ponti]MCP8939742.1 NfeD family protein [Alsobacter ponti]